MNRPDDEMDMKFPIDLCIKENGNVEIYLLGCDVCCCEVFFKKMAATLTD